MSKPICVFQAPLWTRSGYGDWAMAVAKSLNRYDKFDLHLIPTRWGGCSRKHLSSQVLDNEELQLFNKVLRTQLTRQPELYIQCTIPPEFQPVGKFNIGMTAGIETTVARGDWIEGLNRMNMNIVTSVHSKNVLEGASYTKNVPNQPPVQLKSVKPMEVVFWGADTTIYKKTDEKVESIESTLNDIPEDFCFLFVGQWTSANLFNDRKDIGNLIKTFSETFRNWKGSQKPPALILKSSGAAICNGDKYEMINKLKAIRLLIAGSPEKVSELPNVYLVYGDLTDKEMNALYNHDKVKVHVSFTHGEGYGHPLLLASLSGKPLMAPNWSGHLDFLNPKYTKLLDGQLAQLPPDAVNEWLIAESGWFNVNYSQAQDSLKNAFYHYGAYLEKAENLRLENSEKFSMKSMDVLLHGVLDKYVPKFAVEQKLVLPKLKKVELPKLVKKD